MMMLTRFWGRVTGEPNVRGVGADRIDFAGGWSGAMPVMEFVREVCAATSPDLPLSRSEIGVGRLE